MNVYRTAVSWQSSANQFRTQPLQVRRKLFVMLSFLRQNTPRTNTAHLNPIKYEGGRAQQHFHDTASQYMVTDIMPATTSKHGRSFFNPPLHFHAHQTEDFEVVSGIGRWYLDGRTVLAEKAGKVHIPQGVFHRFENASETGEDLVVSFRLDEQDFMAEERFFRNFFGYIDDCFKTGKSPSFLQLCLFLYTIRTPVVLPGLGQKSTWLGRQLSWAAMLLFGVVIGQGLLGYKSSYPEYYRERVEPSKTK